MADELKVTEAIEPKSNDVTPDLSQKGAMPDAAKAAELDALKSQLAESTKLLKKFQDDAEAKKTKELEEQGKHKELIEDLRLKNKALESGVKSAERRLAITQHVVTTVEESPKAVLELALMIDREGGDLDIDALCSKAVEKLAAWGVKGETLAFGATGGPKGGAGGIQAKLDKLKVLFKSAQATNRQDDKEKYSYYRKQLMDENIAIPTNFLI